MSMDYWGNGRRRIETQKDYEERTRRKGSSFETCMIFLCLVALVIGCIVTWATLMRRAECVCPLRRWGCCLKF